jgi:hypothetical protein
MKYLTNKIVRNISFRVKYPPPIIISFKYLNTQSNVQCSVQSIEQSSIYQTNKTQTIVNKEYPEYPCVEQDILYYLETEDKK